MTIRDGCDDIVVVVVVKCIGSVPLCELCKSYDVMDGVVNRNG